MTGAPVPAGIVEAAAEAIYNSWWEDGEPDESARWENLEPDDDDRVSALKAARVALAAALPVLLADLADRIETMAGALLHIEGYWCGYIDGLRSSADVVRSFASEVSRG